MFLKELEERHSTLLITFTVKHSNASYFLQDYTCGY